MNDGLKFRGKGTLVDSSADKKEKARFTQVQAPKGKTLLPACLILIIAEDTRSS
jgi:hypothetical protein